MSDKDADFTAFVRTETPSLMRSAYLLTGDAHLAEDLVQTALARTHRAWHRVDFGSAAAYARRTLYNLRVSWWRRHRNRERPMAVLADRAAPGADLALHLTVRKALAGLPRRQRAVIVLRFFEDRDVAQTAAILGCAEGTVKSHTFKALRSMRAALPGLSAITEGSR